MSDFSAFPEKWILPQGDAIDNFIRWLGREHRGVFDAIRNSTVWFLNSIYGLLTLLPWWLLIALVVLAGYKVSKRLTVGVMYGAMIFCVGMFGMWFQMLETLSIVIAGVFISLLLGFPLGVLVAITGRAQRVIRPILDLMQTMPTFVYLVPAVMLFSVGKTPAVMATTIYSIVPIIRMTDHGIRHVDAEVVEAARAFGSNTMQTLIKVQIPQAVPTIMTGVNQTIMMAMSMVVTCALIGANGLGMEILVATNRTEMGRALLPGISIVFVAIILDRLTQGIIKTDPEDETMPVAAKRPGIITRVLRSASAKGGVTHEQ